MSQALQIVFHGLDPSDALGEHVRTRFEKLHHVYDRIIHCRTAIERPNHHHRQGEPIRIGIHLTMPGHEVVVWESGEDAYAAVGAAFDRARRQLDSRTER